MTFHLAPSAMYRENARPSTQDHLGVFQRLLACLLYANLGRHRYIQLPMQGVDELVDGVPVLLKEGSVIPALGNALRTAQV